jgi:hypothetical protein
MNNEEYTQLIKSDKRYELWDKVRIPCGENGLSNNKGCTLNKTYGEYPSCNNCHLVKNSTLRQVFKILNYELIDQLKDTKDNEQ